MKIIDLLKELSDGYSNLNGTLSMCYLVSSNEVFVENMIIGQNLYLGRTLFDACYKANAKGDNLVGAHKELIISDTEVLCIQLGNMYFVPGITTGIIFSKDFELLKKSYWVIKGVNYKFVKM